MREDPELMSNDAHVMRNRRFLEHLSEQRIFEVKLETVSACSVDFLAVTVSKDKDGAYRTVPRDKPDHMYLSSSSLHPPSVHRMWPRNLLENYSKLCSQTEDVSVFVQNIIQRLRRSHINPNSIRDIICQYELGQHKKNVIARVGPSQGGLDNVPRPVPGNFWMPLPFSTGAYRAIPKVVRLFNSDVQFQHLWELVGRTAPNIGVS